MGRPPRAPEPRDTSCSTEYALSQLCVTYMPCVASGLGAVQYRSGVFSGVLQMKRLNSLIQPLRARVGEVRTTRALLLSEHLDVEALKFPNQRYGPIHSKACIPNSNWLSVCRAHPSQSTGAILLGIQNFTVSN